MPTKRKICTENLNSNQSIFIPSLNSYYQPESVLNSAYRKVLDFKENAEKILEKEKSETLNLNDFSKAILDSRSFEIALHNNCIKLKCYITLEKDKDIKKNKRNEQGQQQQQQQTPPGTPLLPQSASTTSLQYSSLVSGCGKERKDSVASTSSCNYISTSVSSNDLHMYDNNQNNNQSTTGGAKKVNVEVIMKSNPFRVEENEKTTRMELVRNMNSDSNMLCFTYYVKPECEAKKFRESHEDMYDDKGRLVMFTNDFFTIYKDPNTGQLNISLNEIVQTAEEQKRTEALGEKLFLLLKERPRHRALLTNECKLNNNLTSSHLISQINNNNNPLLTPNQTPSSSPHPTSSSSGQYCFGNNSTNSLLMITSQEDETYYTRELINIYGQPIVPSFHKHFNYQLSNTHYGYRTLRRLLNCDILKKFVKITKEEINMLDRVVEFVQLTSDKCLSAIQLNIANFYDPVRFENGIIKNWLDVWYVERLKEKYASINNNANDQQQQQQQNLYSGIGQNSLNHLDSLTSCSSWSATPSLNINSSFKNCFLNTFNCNNITSKSSCSNNEMMWYDQNQNGYYQQQQSECDQTNHLWFCLRDYLCNRMEEFIYKLKDYIKIRNNDSELILVHTVHPLFEYKNLLSETRRILALFLNKSTHTKPIDELISNKYPQVAKYHVESLLNKFFNIDNEKRTVVGFTALFEILMILKRELAKEKNDEMKYSHFLCTLERANQEKLKMAIVQLKCVPCLNKFTTNINLVPSSALVSPTSPTNSNNVSNANMSRLLKQMSLVISTELQQIAIDLIERIEDDKPVKYIRLKEEFRSSHNYSLAHNQTNQSDVHNKSTNQFQINNNQSQQQLTQKQASALMNSLVDNFSKKIDMAPPSKQMSQITAPQVHILNQQRPIFNPHRNLQRFLNHENKSTKDYSSFKPHVLPQHSNIGTHIFQERY